MFRKKQKKNTALFSAVDDSKIVVYDFKLRSSSGGTGGAGYESYRTVNYRLYHKLEEAEMLPRLEEHLSKLFAGDVDSANADMLDALLFGSAREALCDLGMQQHDHQDTIRRLIVRRKADREDILNIIEGREAEVEAMRIDFETTCKMLARENVEV